MLRAGFVGAFLLGGVYAVGAFDLPRRMPRTTNVMPKPKRLAPNGDGRFYAVIQVCTRPAEVKLALHYAIGPIDKIEGTGNLDCREPWTRKGLVQRGDLVSLGWAVNPVTTLRGVRYRITVNNQMVIESEAADATKYVPYRVTGLEAG